MEERFCRWVVGRCNVTYSINVFNVPEPHTWKQDNGKLYVHFATIENTSAGQKPQGCQFTTFGKEGLEIHNKLFLTQEKDCEIIVCSMQRKQTSEFLLRGSEDTTEGKRHRTWARGVLGWVTYGIFTTGMQSASGARRRSQFRTGTLSGTRLILHEFPPFPLQSPYLIWPAVRSGSVALNIPSWVPGPAPSTSLTMKVPGWKVGGSLALVTRTLTVALAEACWGLCSCPPSQEKSGSSFSTTTTRLHAGWVSWSKGCHPREKVSLVPVALPARGSLSAWVVTANPAPVASVLHLLFTLSLIMIKRQLSAHFQIIYRVLFFFPSLLLVEKSHHQSEGNEKCNKNHNLMKH